MKLRPFVTVSYAQSADGRIATSTGMSQWISGEETLEFAHTLRRDNQAILAGIGTVITDDPMLTCRLPENAENCSPLRIVADSNLRIPMHSKIIKSAEIHRTIVFCLETAEKSRIEKLSAYSVEVIQVPPDSTGQIDLHSMLAHLYKTGIKTLYVEGGSRILTSFFRLRLVDRLYAVCAPMIIGEGIPAVGNLNVENISDAWHGRTVSVKQAGNDIIWEIALSDDKPSPPGISTEAEALYFTAPFSVSLRKEKLFQKSGEILVQSKVSGISHGTENHIYRGSFPRGKALDSLPGFDTDMDYPVKYGYMNAGITPGGEKVFAFFPHQNLFYYNEKNLISFPDTAGFEDIVFYPSVETAYNIILDSSPVPGERILIIGQGMIGLLAAEILTRFTGLHVAAIEPDSFRQSLSRSLGVSCFAPAGLERTELCGMVKEMFGGFMPDIVIHVSGTEKGLQSAIDCAAFEGKIIEASWFGTEPVTLNLGESFHRKRLSLISSQVSSVPGKLFPRWDRARRTAEVKKWIEIINPAKYITHRYRFSQAEAAFKEIEEKREGMLQAVLIPDNAEREV